MEIRCDFCGKNSIFQIASCQKLDTLSCPYKLKIEQYNSFHKKFGIFGILFGLIFVVISLILSSTTTVHIEELWIKIALYLFYLPFLFVGLGITAAGLFILAGKQYTFTSNKSFSFMIYKIFNQTLGYTLNTPLEDIKTVISDEENFEYPLSILLLNESDKLDFSDKSVLGIIKLVKFRIVTQQKNFNDNKVIYNQDNAEEIIRRILIYLISQNVLKVKKHISYNYILNFRINTKNEKIKYLIFKGSNFDNYKSDGVLENKILTIITNWQQIKGLTEPLFSPDISLVTKYLLSNSVPNPYLAVCEIVRKDGINLKILQQTSNNNIFRKEFIEISANTKNKMASLEEKFKIYNKDFFETIYPSIREGLNKLDSSD